MVYLVSGRGSRGSLVIIKKTLAEAERQAANMEFGGFKNVKIKIKKRLWLHRA